MTKIHLIVTQKDIDDGEPGSECDCPIALALMRCFPMAEQVAVNEGDITIHTNNGYDYFLRDTSPVVDLFIRYFDSLGSGIPFETDLIFSMDKL